VGEGVDGTSVIKRITDSGESTMLLCRWVWVWMRARKRVCGFQLCARAHPEPATHSPYQICAHLLTASLTHLPTRSLACLFTHSFSDAFICAATQWLTHSPTHGFSNTHPGTFPG
jgi:hypothetical protein